jgi:hypothetical protein
MNCSFVPYFFFFFSLSFGHMWNIDVLNPTLQSIMFLVIFLPGIGEGY